MGGDGLCDILLLSGSISAVIYHLFAAEFADSVAAAIASLACIGQAISMDQGFSADETTVTREQELPLDAMGYLGGLFEARFYEPHSTTDDPHDEIRDAASLYGLDLAMICPSPRSKVTSILG